MACRLVGAKPLSNQCLNIVNWTHGNKLQRNFNRNSNIFFQENAFENVVWKITAILSRSQCDMSLGEKLCSDHNFPVGAQNILSEVG